MSGDVPFEGSGAAFKDEVNDPARRPSNDNGEPPGFVYVTDQEGNIVECEMDSWSSFARQNGAQALAEAENLNVFDACSDPETVATYRMLHALIHCRKLDCYSFDFRCDSPGRVRLFRMTVTGYPVLYSGAVLYWCQLLMQRDRPPVKLLEFKPGRPVLSLQLVKICSFCQRVRDVLDEHWMEAEDHPAAKKENVPISHGVCADCHERVVRPLLRASQEK